MKSYYVAAISSHGIVTHLRDLLSGPGDKTQIRTSWPASVGRAGGIPPQFDEIETRVEGDSKLSFAHMRLLCPSLGRPPYDDYLKRILLKCVQSGGRI